MLKKLQNKKGFTLMEMLIVVAIIAVLVAIAIPVFTNQLEKAREATDAANIRSAYAEVMATALTDTDRATATDAKLTNDVKKTVTDGKAVWSKDVNVVQKQTEWQNTTIAEIAGLPTGKGTTDGTKVTADTLKGWTVKYDEVTGATTITEKTN